MGNNPGPINGPRNRGSKGIGNASINEDFEEWKHARKKRREQLKTKIE
jgi:hypothetical protein